MKVYVASSWRNVHQPEVVQCLRSAGYTVYDFRNPHEHTLEREQGFHWTDIDPTWQSWTVEQFIAALEHPLAQDGFNSDFTNLREADAVVLVAPCGRSAHLELGFAVGRNIPTIMLLDKGEPELMYKMATHLAINLDEVLSYLHFEAHRIGPLPRVGGS